MKTAAEFEQGFVAAALAAGNPAEHVEQLRPIYAHFAREYAELWQRVERLAQSFIGAGLAIDGDVLGVEKLHEQLDEIAKRPGFARRRANEQSAHCPVFDTTERNWMETDEQLRTRIKGELPKVVSIERMEQERAAYDQWRTRMNIASALEQFEMRDGYMRQVNAAPVPLNQCGCSCASCVRNDCEHCVDHVDHGG